MRKPIDSPFSPGSDAVPQIWAGRAKQLSDWRDIVRPRRHSGVYERGRTILGEAGLGKSSLVGLIARQAAEAGDWVTPQLRIPVGSDPMKKVASALLDLAATAGLSTRRDRRIAELLARVETVAAAGVSLTLRGSAGAGTEPYTALTDLLVEVGRAAIDAQAVVVIRIDEVQNIDNPAALSQILTALGDALAYEITVGAPGDRQFTRVLPLAVYLTGLPEFTEMATARQGATFARRFQTDVLRPVTDADLSAALQVFLSDGWPVMRDAGGLTPVYMEPGARDTIVELSCGEPFLFQLAGAQGWYANATDTITRRDVLEGWSRITGEAEAHVLSILDRLPTREREFVEAMAALEPGDRTMTRIASDAGFTAAQGAGTTTRRLDTTRGIIDRGKPYTFRHRAIEAYLTSTWPRLYL
ncbi:ATP-binding protein [Corynebacterium sp. AOP12-C2-36]|uniref:ATP-binding protein n=1 Tax=Corynebacterium sp. AOP12-C2-36 TaxID=3457723 RepID=UPI004034B08D